jgi:hypothetical protein
VSLKIIDISATSETKKHVKENNSNDRKRCKARKGGKRETA